MNKSNHEEVALFFYNGDDPEAILVSNGHSQFYRLKKMGREDVSRLLASEEPTKWQPP